jgi:hypothetical protein
MRIFSKSLATKQDLVVNLQERASEESPEVCSACFEAAGSAGGFLESLDRRSIHLLASDRFYASPGMKTRC